MLSVCTCMSVFVCVYVLCSYKVWEGLGRSRGGVLGKEGLRVEVRLTSEISVPHSYSLNPDCKPIHSFIVSLFDFSVIVKTVSGSSSTTGSVKKSARGFLRSLFCCLGRRGSSDQSNKSSNNGKNIKMLSSVIIFLVLF